jgi:parallel beta-helix repeat protein
VSAAHRRILPFLAVLWLAATRAVFAVEDAAKVSGAVDKDTVWKGRVAVERTVTVGRGAVLTVQPGTVVSFRPGAGLTVEGRLVAEGRAEEWIRFLPDSDPSPEGWEGIRFADSAAGSVLSRCIVRGAAAVEIAGPGIDVRDCELGKGKVGLVFRMKAEGAVTGNVIREMSEGGIQCHQGASPRIERNVLRDCGPFGIACSQNAAPVVRGNDVSGCDRGLSFNGGIPPVEGNSFVKNGAGVVATSSGRIQVIRGNRFEGNEAGLVCEQFSDPLVEGNTFSGNKTALICFRSSSPLVRRNEIAGNGQGIVCNQLCHPRIEGNEIRGNGKGIYLTLSSYATVTGNNIHGNAVQMELGNMSSDWERRVREKPVRGNVAQLATQVGRGVAGTREIRQFQGDNAVVTAAVDASGNWWGEKDTEEMERKGSDAEISGLVDYFDVPVRTYEGYPGEYVQDRIRYDGWRKTRIPDAGVPKKGEGAGG